MFNAYTMKYFIALNVFFSLLTAQDDVRVAPKKISDRVQVIVSGNHPDAINNESTIIFDNSKNIDLRSNNRPIKNTVPTSDTEEELFLPNEVMPTLSIEETKNNSSQTGLIRTNRLYLTYDTDALGRWGDCDIGNQASSISAG